MEARLVKALSPDIQHAERNVGQRQTGIEPDRLLQITLCAVKLEGMQKEVAQVELRFGLRQGGALHLRIERQFLVKGLDGNRVEAATDILLQLVFQPPEVRLKSLLEGSVNGQMRGQQIEELFELPCTLALVAEQ